MFSIIIMQLSFFVNLKVLDVNFYKNTLNKNDYFSLMRKDIDYSFNNLSMITSIPEKVFVSSVSNEDVKKLAYYNIDSSQGYMKYNNSYTDNRIDTNVVYNNLQNYVQKKNIKIDVNMKNQLLSVSTDVGNIVGNHSNLFNISAVDKYPQFQSFRKLVYLLYNIKILSIIILLLMVALLAYLNRRRPRRTFLWLGSSFIASSIMTLIPSFLALYYKIPNRFAINTAYLKVALRDIALGYIKYFTITGAIVLLIGIFCMFIYNYLSNHAHIKHQRGTSQ